MDSPRPVPPLRWPSSSWVKASNTLSRTDAGIPGPVSSMQNMNLDPPGPAAASSGRPSDTRSVTPPVSVNLTALPRMLIRTWRSLPTSPCNRTGPGGTPGPAARSQPTRQASPASRHCTSKITDRSRTSCRRSKSVGCSSTRPASILDRSRTSLTKWSRWAPLRSMMVTDWRWSALSPRSRCKMRAKPSTAFNGVRISWLMFAKNMLLAFVATSNERLDSSSAARALRSCASICSRSRSDSRRFFLDRRPENTANEANPATPAPPGTSTQRSAYHGMKTRKRHRAGSE